MRRGSYCIENEYGMIEKTLTEQSQKRTFDQQIKT